MLFSVFGALFSVFGTILDLPWKVCRALRELLCRAAFAGDAVKPPNKEASREENVDDATAFAFPCGIIISRVFADACARCQHFCPFTRWWRSYQRAPSAVCWFSCPMHVLSASVGLYAVAAIVVTAIVAANRMAGTIGTNKL